MVLNLLLPALHFNVPAGLLLLIHCLLQLQQTNGVPLSEFFDFGTSAGDQALPKADDPPSQTLNLDVPFIFYDKSYTVLDVNINGILAFGEDTDVSYTPTQFPRSSTVPVIAPYWADIDTRGTGDVFIRDSTTDTNAINKVQSLIATHFEDFQNFVAAEVVIVTWDRVGYYNQRADKVNTFQCVVASDGTNTFVIFLYLDDGINWTTGNANGGTDGLGGIQAQAGFDAGNQNDFRVIEGSFTNDIINIEEKSNVDVPGLFIFQINGFIRAANEEPCPVVGSNACKERVIELTCQHLFNTPGANIPLPCRERLSD